MIKIRKNISPPIYKYKNGSGISLRSGKSVYPIIRLATLFAICNIAYLTTNITALAAQTGNIAAQQKFVATLTQLQSTIDSAATDIQNKLYIAQRQVNSVAIQLSRANGEADKEVAQDLLKLSTLFLLTATDPPRSTSERVSKAVEILVKANEIAASLAQKLVNNQEAHQVLLGLNQQLADAKTSLSKLQKLQMDRDRAISDARKAGLLPDIDYNPKTGIFTVTSTPRALNTQAQASTKSSAVRAANADIEPDPLAIGIIFEAIIYYTDTLDVERIVTAARVKSFTKCMMENRRSKLLHPTFLINFATQSAQIIRAKGAEISYWPIGRRTREFGNRRSEFDFQFSGPPHDFQKVTGKMNALVPAGLRNINVSLGAVLLSLSESGLPDYKICYREPKRAPTSIDNDEN